MARKTVIDKPLPTEPKKPRKIKKDRVVTVEPIKDDIKMSIRLIF